MNVKVQPLSGPPPAEVPLLRAPLVRVIAQVRFAPILAIRNPDKVASFQEEIRSTYPLLSEERVHHLAIQPPGIPESRESLIWRFVDDVNQPQWRVSLGIDFVSLETSAYASRSDFLERLSLILTKLENSFKPAEAQRFGLRYIDRLTDDALDQIHDLIKPDILGIALPVQGAPSPLGRSATFLLTEAQFQADEGLLMARWGNLPANATYDPDALEPFYKPSWIIDLDMFTSSPQPFTTSVLLETASNFAARAYSVFRMMVTEDFLKFYGGNT